MLKSAKLEHFLSKKRNIFILYGIVSISILLLAFSNFSGDKPKKQTADMPEEAALADMLADILSSMQGVGKAEVAVTYETGVETVPMANVRGEDVSVVTLGTGSGARIAAKKEIMPKVRGVLVIAEGGADATVRANILYAVQALTGAPMHSIAIFAAK